MQIIDSDLTIEPSFIQSEYAPISEPTFKELELNRYQCSLHIGLEVLSMLSRITDDGSMPMEGLRLFINTVSRETQNRLANMQPVSEGHPVIIDRVNIAEQVATCQIVVHIEFWAIQHADADLGRAAFERTLHECLAGA